MLALLGRGAARLASLQQQYSLLPKSRGHLNPSFAYIRARVVNNLRDGMLQVCLLSRHSIFEFTYVFKLVFRHSLHS